MINSTVMEGVVYNIMIIIDIETTGIDPVKNCMVSLGAVDYITGEEFYGECITLPDTIIDDVALSVNGFTRHRIAKHDLTPFSLYRKFVLWAHGRENVLGGQQVGSFDILFLHQYAGGKVEFEKRFSRRSVDLHSVAYAKWKVSLGLDGILNKLGLPSEQKPHNALTGAKLERDAFKKLLT